MIPITLEQIKAHNPCKEGWKLVQKNGQSFPISDIIKSNGLEHAIWALRCVDPIIAKRFALGCAEMVRHLMSDAVTLLDVAALSQWQGNFAKIERGKKCNSVN